MLWKRVSFGQLIYLVEAASIRIKKWAYNNSKHHYFIGLVRTKKNHSASFVIFIVLIFKYIFLIFFMYAVSGYHIKGEEMTKEHSKHRKEMWDLV